MIFIALAMLAAPAVNGAAKSTWGRTSLCTLAGGQLNLIQKIRYDLDNEVLLQKWACTFAMV